MERIHKKTDRGQNIQPDRLGTGNTTGQIGDKYTARQIGDMINRQTDMERIHN
jgi:hypothetical protein